MEDLNLLSEELLEQIFVYLIDINWEEDQIDEILFITQLPIYKYISR